MNSGAEPVVVPDREGLGRSRGGLTTKIHLVADSRCRPDCRGLCAKCGADLNEGPCPHAAGAHA